MKQFLIFGVFYQIITHKKISAKAIADIYEVSTRSIYRYVDSLCLAGIPICSTTGRDGGFYISKEFNIKAVLSSLGDATI